MIDFDYRQERLRTGEIIFRPVAKVYLLRREGEWVAEYFYVDSGTDYTLIPYRMGRFLGLGKIASEIREMGGIGGIILVPMRIETHRFDCTIAWAQIEQVPLLLGREGDFSAEKQENHLCVARVIIGRQPATYNMAFVASFKGDRS